MPRILFIEHDGTEYPVDAANGTTLMQAALANDIPGIPADCGWQCACATCHVYLDPTFLGSIGAAGSEEAEMLDCAIDPEPNSRLSCQIEISEALEGLIVRIPESQL